MPPLSFQTASSESKDYGRRNHDIADFCDKIEEESTENGQTSCTNSTTEQKFPVRIVWRNVIIFALLHLAALYGFQRMFTSAKWQTNALAVFLYLASALGVTAGAHRLWSHRSYKARLPVRILLAFFFTMTFQNDVYEWCRDHRVHHKYSETDADPHNARRGFFFAHVGWLLCRKHPDVIKKGKAVDLSDVLADPVVRFQRKYYLYLVTLCCFILPTAIPMYFWNETFVNSFFVAAIFRLCLTFNVSWMGNSAAHMWGSRPYDARVWSRENTLLVLSAVGEGYHNFHHTFPYDYAASEFGFKYNITTAFIDLMAWLGFVVDRKRATVEVIRARKLRTGEDSLKLKNN